MTRSVFIPAALVALLLAAGCGRSRAPILPDPNKPLTAVLSTNTVLIGQPFTFTAAVKAAPEDRINWPTPGLPPAVIPRNSREIAEGIPPGFRAKQWELMALRPGTFPVWTASVTRVTSDGKSESLAPPQIEVRVSSSLQSGDEAICDIAGLQQWPRAIATRLLIVLGAVILLALLLALLARKLLRKKEKPAPSAPALPPHEIALRALRSLRARGWPDASGVEAFYIELSTIVRRFLEGAFRMRAPEQTTEEFIRSATTSRALQLDHQQLVFAFLEQSDLVKFARHEPAQSDMESALAAAERLVQETQPPALTETTQPTPRAV